VVAATVIVGADDPLSRALAGGLDGLVAPRGHPLPSGITGAVVIVGTDPPPVPSDLTMLSEDAFNRAVDDVMWNALSALQSARAAIGEQGGRIVVVVPTIGMAGAAQLVGYTTALEGVRAMAKSAARQWHRDGVTVNLVAAPLRLFVPTLDAAAAHLTAAVVTDDSGLIHTVTEAVAFLLRSDIDHLVGETIIADGGAVMLP
jgi:3-oxoacyl-[acyl-carrier protein] reductase